MATRREVLGGLVVVLLSLAGTQALAQTPASSSTAAEQLATFNKSFGACLGGRGYSVK